MLCVCVLGRIQTLAEKWKTEKQEPIIEEQNVLFTTSREKPESGHAPDLGGTRI